MSKNGNSPYSQGLEKVGANYVPMSPISLIERAAHVYPERISVIDGPRKFTWAETYARCRRLASALRRREIGYGDTVAVIASNITAMYEAHFGVPMCGAVLNTVNIRLDAEAIAFILDHGEADVVIVDKMFSKVAKEALALSGRTPLVIDIDDEGIEGELLGEIEYEKFLLEGDPDFAWSLPADEWDPITLNYTSGTTGDPKGVVYHHRGAFLNALGNTVSWEMGDHPVYLWILPMFHCNGWCFPWTMAVKAGTNVCLRQVTAKGVYDALADHGVTHFCGAPIVLNTIVNAPEAEKREFSQKVRAMTAGAPPPASVLAATEAIGFEVTQTYGLTEVYGPTVVSVWKSEWDSKTPAERAALKARQGVKYHVLEGLEVMNPETMEPVPADGETMGEVMFRGNVVMKGYLKNPKTTDDAFAGGWFHSGDLAVRHPDGYIQLKDRSKDIIISGGENISSVEVEEVLYRHPAVLEAAVVARPDEKWGETPCAFVTLKQNAPAIREEELFAFCKENLARFKLPKTIVFGELPKTSTGKIQKFQLREQAKNLA